MSRGPSHAGDDPHADEELVTAGTDLESADAALVLVHGRGATARSIVGFGEEVAGDGAVALLAPQAAVNTWYPNSFLAPVAENEPGRGSGRSGRRSIGRSTPGSAATASSSAASRRAPASRASSSPGTRRGTAGSRS